MRHALLSLLIGAVAVLAPPCARAQSEYQVKGAILFNIARFVEWPPARRGQATVTLCVLGADPFGPEFAALDGRSVGTGVLRIRQINRADEAAICNMLFLPDAEARRLPELLAAVREHRVLTVGETPGMAERGLVLNLYIDNGRVRFEINLDAAQRSGLTISSQLLKLARITHDRS